MFIVFALLMVIVSVAVVAYPVVRGADRAGPRQSSARAELDELLAQREAAFQALRELRFDHQVGKVSDEDFAVFEAHLKQSAAAALQALDEWEAAADRGLEQVLEAEIAARRAALAGAGRFCPACGRPAAAEDRFCGRCGASLAPAAASALSAPRACPHCGTALDPGDRFCSGCGRPA